MLVKAHTDRFVDGRVELSFIRAGTSADQALLIHGFGSDRMSWILNQAVAAAHTTIFALDLPAHGASTAEVGDGSVEFLTERVAAFTTAKMDKPAHIVAHSLGGAVAIDLALRRPELVRSMFLIAPVGLGQGVNQTFLNEFPEIQDLESATRLLQKLVHRPRTISKEMAIRVLNHLQRPGVREALRLIAAQLQIVGGNLSTRVPKLNEVLSRPVQIVWGNEDAINPVREIPSANAKFSFEVIDGAGHLPHMEKAGTVNALLDRFLTSAQTTGESA
jgi:pyruvate dehydrogenase E2 component (dihydrolipoamide acetyltransferase)